jgi:prepilin-type N-terminal cleavage/methylation domain-containing protein
MNVKRLNFPTIWVWRSDILDSSKGFTLTELLVVLSIILILLGIGLPTYRNARIRGQVALAHANLHGVETALDWYASDHGSYPGTTAVSPGDPLALLADHQLQVLTTPVAYLSESSLRDPFGVVEAQTATPVLSSGNDFPKLAQPNEDRSLLYFHYPSLASRLLSPALSLNGAGTVSLGPDRKDSFGAYRPFGAEFFTAGSAAEDYLTPLDTVYSPTNGIFSSGDIARFVGEARRFRVP